MREIYIDKECEIMPYEWYEWVSPDLPEYVVITGNRDFVPFDDAEWYQKAKEILADLDYEYLIDISYYGISDSQLEKIKKLYDSCDLVGSETIVSVANIMNPEMDIDFCTIRGCVQRDWNIMYYDKKRITEHELEVIDDYYFGLVTEIYTTDECGCGCSSYLSDRELWKLEREDKLDSFLRSEFDIAEDEDIKIFESDGYEQRKKWKAV